MKKFIVDQAKTLKGKVKVPGDKSISHRAVMLGSIAKGDTTIENFLRSDDCMRTVDCFRKMGIEIIIDGKNCHRERKGIIGTERTV